MQFWTATLPILFVCLFLLCRCSMSIPMSFVKRTIRTLEFNNIIHLTNTCGTTIQMLRIVHLEVLENSTNTHHHQLNAHAQFTLHSAFRIISAFSIRCHPSLFYSVYKSTAIVDCRRQKLQRMTLHLSTTHFQLYIYTLSIRFDPIFPYKYSSVLHYFFLLICTQIVALYFIRPQCILLYEVDILLARQYPERQHFNCSLYSFPFSCCSIYLACYVHVHFI